MILATLCYASASAAVDDSATHVWVGLHGGAGVGVYRDEGLSPLLYRGLEIHPALTVEIRQPLWRFNVAASIDGGAYGYTLSLAGLHAFGGQLSVAFQTLRRIAAIDSWTLWAGAGIDDLFDIRYNPSFGNSSEGSSNFARLNLAVRAEV